MKKFSKFMLAIMIAFMQLSSPIQVFADVIEDEILDDNISDVSDNKVNANNDDMQDEAVINNEVIDDTNQAIDTKDDNSKDVVEDETVDDNNSKQIDDSNNDQDKIVNNNNDDNDVDQVDDKSDTDDSTTDDIQYKFDIDGKVENNKVKVNINSNNQGNFIAKVMLTFNHIQDNQIKDTKEEEKIYIIDDNAVELNDIGANLNGKYNLDVNIYKVDEELNNDEESLKEYISDKEVIYNESKVIKENDIKTAFYIFTDGNNDIVCEDNICNLDKDASNKNVSVSYETVEGDKNTENSYVKYVINNKIELNNVNLNFNNLIYGNYEIKGILYNSDDEEIANDTLTIKYDSYDNNDLVNYFTDNNISEQSKNISMTLLDEKTKKELVGEIVDNAFIDNLECIVNVDSDNSYFMTEYCYGKLDDSDGLPKVSEIIQVLNNAGIDANIIDKNGNTVSLNDDIGTKMLLKVNFSGIETQYTIIIKGDIDNGVVEDSDINTVIDNLFNNNFDDIDKIASDVNKDNEVNILDVSIFAGAICDKFWYVADNYNDNLIATFERENNNFIKVGDTFKINLKLSGFNDDYINAIEGILDYDKSVFELISVDGIEKLVEFSKLSNGKFINAGSYMYKDGIVVSLTFKALSASDATIKLNSLIGAMDGVKLNITNNASIDISVDEDTNNSNNDSSNPIANFSEEVNDTTNDNSVDNNIYNETINNSNNNEVVNVISTIDNRVYYNNYLAKLEIEGYEIDFDKNILEYEITVDNDVDSLDITAIAEDSRSSVRIYGNSNFKEGENIVKVIVTAQDGSDRTYVIKVNKKEAEVTNKKDSNDKEDDVKTNNVEKTVIIILIILVVLGLLYLIFKKDDEEEKK